MLDSDEEEEKAAKKKHCVKGGKSSYKNRWSLKPRSAD